MENPKRARSGKPRTRPRGRTYVDCQDLQSALARIRQAAAADRRHVSLSEPAFVRYDLRQEPYEVVPHVRICAGGAGIKTSVPTATMWV